MTTFSLCMIVKNEEKVLDRCLSSIADLMDEIIIVDTGSTDGTKAVASKYTDKVYDYVWCDDFSAARNYSFSLATGDYIYAADADEYLDEYNRKQLAFLKEVIEPEVEIVQMLYHTVSEDTVLNLMDEYRPKLFKRLRTFRWIDPIHESVALDPMVFDSDITITHAPVSNHAGRDFGIYQKALARDGGLSDHVAEMYAIELYKMGRLQDLQDAQDFFEGELARSSGRDEISRPGSDVPNEDRKLNLNLVNSEMPLSAVRAFCLLAHLERLEGASSSYLGLIQNPDAATSEYCCDYGALKMTQGKFKEAISWLSQAVEAAPFVLDVHTTGDIPLGMLVECYAKMGNAAKAAEVKRQLEDWRMPQETMKY